MQVTVIQLQDELLVAWILGFFFFLPPEHGRYPSQEEVKLHDAWNWHAAP